MRGEPPRWRHRPAELGWSGGRELRKNSASRERTIERNGSRSDKEPLRAYQSCSRPIRGARSLSEVLEAYQSRSEPPRAYQRCSKPARAAQSLSAANR